MTRGKEATLKERYAAALLHLEAARCKIDPTLQACIDREKAKTLTPEQIIGLFDVDHEPIAKFYGGSNHPTNLNPKAKQRHRVKTSKKDSPAMAKTRRILKDDKFAVVKVEPSASLTDAKFPWKEVALTLYITPKAKRAMKGEKKKWASKPMPGTLKSGIRKPMRGRALRRSSAPTSK